jgi:mannosyltransferase
VDVDLAVTDETLAPWLDNLSTVVRSREVALKRSRARQPRSEAGAAGWSRDSDKGSSSASERGWLVWGLLILLLLSSAALRLYDLDGKGLWFDELGTALYTMPDKALLEVVRGPLEVPVIAAPPLYFLSTYLFRQVSESESLLRLPSVFYGVLSIAAVFALGKALLGRREGLIGAFLLAVSGFHLRYSQEARYYSLLVLLATFSLYFFYRGLHRNNRLSWAGYVLSTSLAVYTHLFALLFVAVEVIYAVICFAHRSLRDGGRTTWQDLRSRSGAPFRGFVWSLVMVALLYVPMLPWTLAGLMSRKGLGGSIPTTINRTSLSYLGGIVDLLGAGPGLALLSYLAALSLGLYFLARRARSQLVLAVLWISLPFLVVFLVPAGHNFRLRYVIFVLPVFLLVVSSGLVGLSQIVCSWMSQRRRKKKLDRLLQPLLLTICCAFFGVLSVGAWQRYWVEEKQPWERAAGFLQSVASAEEMVVTVNEGVAERLLYYAYDASDVTFLVPCPCPAPSSVEDWYRFPELCDQREQVWILDPSPNFRHLGPDSYLSDQLEEYVFLPEIVFKGHSSSSIVEKDLLGPFTTSDVGVLPVLRRDAGRSDREILELGSRLAKRAEELYPGETRSEFTQAELERYYGSEDRAITRYEAAIADDADYYPAYEGLALIHVSRADIPGALELYSDLSRTGRIRESDYHFLLGSARLAEGSPEQAISEFTLAVRSDPGNVEYRLWLGDAYLAAARLDDAMAQFDEAIRMDGSNAVVYGRRGNVYRAQGRLVEAAGEYETAVKLSPGDPLYHALLAEVYGQQGLLEQALAQAEEALRLGQGGASYHDLLGQILRALGRASEAVAEAEQAVSLKPTVLSYQVNLAEAYRLAGRREEAIAVYERVLEVDPQNTTAARLLQELR